MTVPPDLVGKCGRQRARGFTLIELVVVAVLLGILAMAVSTPLLQGLMARKEVADDLDAIGKLRYGAERIAREIRQMQYDTTNGYVLALQNAYTSTSPNYGGLAIQSSSGVCFTRWGALGAASSVAIKQSGTTVTYDASCSAAGSPLIDNVSSLKFDFLAFGGSGNVISPSLASPTFLKDIRFIDITLTLTQNGASLSHRTRVSLRNGI